jgi:hypothetical protein
VTSTRSRAVAAVSAAIAATVLLAACVSSPATPPRPSSTATTVPSGHALAPLVTPKPSAPLDCQVPTASDVGALHIETKNGKPVAGAVPARQVSFARVVVAESSSKSSGALEVLIVDGAPKSGAAARYVPLNAAAVNALGRPQAPEAIRQRLAEDLLLANTCLSRQQDRQ